MTSERPYQIAYPPSVRLVVCSVVCATVGAVIGAGTAPHGDAVYVWTGIGAVVGFGLMSVQLGIESLQRRSRKRHQRRHLCDCFKEAA